MRITKLTPSKKVRDRYCLDLEDGSSVTVNVNLIADHSLYTGRDLTDEELDALRNDADRAQLRARALRITGTRAMSRRELTDRLAEKGADEPDAEETADWLEKLGVLNDEEYAKMTARHYASRGYGEGRVRDELYRRGVPKELWEDALAEMEVPEEKIDRLIESRLRGSADEKAVQKVTAMLLRRGFKWDAVRRALERYKISIEESEYDI